MKGWRKVTDAVHKFGSRMVIQISHGGRACHPEHIGGKTPISASAIAIRGSAHGVKGDPAYAVPKEATEEDI